MRLELRAAHEEFCARRQDAVLRIVLRGRRQGVFRSDVDLEGVALRLTAFTDGVAVQVRTGAPRMTVSVLRELLIDFVRRALVAQPEMRKAAAVGYSRS